LRWRKRRRRRRRGKGRRARGEWVGGMWSGGREEYSASEDICNRPYRTRIRMAHSFTFPDFCPAMTVPPHRPASRYLTWHATQSKQARPKQIQVYSVQVYSGMLEHIALHDCLHACAPCAGACKGEGLPVPAPCRTCTAKSLQLARRCACSRACAAHVAGRATRYEHQRRVIC